MKTDLVVADYIFDRDKLLLIHHKELGLWLPVGGHIEKNETSDDAALRESKEEVNLDVKLLSQSNIPVVGNTKRNLATPFYVNVHSVGNHDHCCFFYICEALNPLELKLKKDEVDDYKWVEKRELISKNYMPMDVTAIGYEAFRLYNTLKVV